MAENDHGDEGLVPLWDGDDEINERDTSMRAFVLGRALTHPQNKLVPFYLKELILMRTPDREVFPDLSDSEFRDLRERIVEATRHHYGRAVDRLVQLRLLSPVEDPNSAAVLYWEVTDVSRAHRVMARFLREADARGWTTA
jgi:hypothetical protein